MFYRIPTDPRPEVSLTGHIRYREGWSDELCHRANVLLFVRSGTFKYEFEYGTEYEVGGGFCHLIPAGAGYRVTVKSDCDYYYIHFSTAEPVVPVTDEDVSGAMNRMKQVQLDSRQTRFYRDSKPGYLYISRVLGVEGSLEKIHYRFARCDETRHGTQELDRIRTANIFESLLITLADDSTAALPKASEQPDALTKITGFINRNYTREISLSTLSEEFGYSKQYIMRLFRENLGTRTSDYINSVKLRHALDLLTFTGMSVSEVAYSLGYSSCYYFSRLFRETFSMSPTEFRNTAPDIP